MRDIARLKCLPDPVEFIQECLHHRLTDAQKRILRAVRDGHKRILVRGANGLGKTRCLADLVLWWLVRWPDSVALTSAPTARQTEALLWVELRKTLAQRDPPIDIDYGAVAAMQ